MEALYLPTEHGQRFCLLHTAATGVVPRGAILYIHPFGDEMNKSRRMAALQSRAFAQRGYEVLQVDLFGCGDSSGDFRDATWEIWLADVRAAWNWLAVRSSQPVWLWGLRTGCLLIDAAARLRNAPMRALFWQPVLSGQRFLQQFLRTRLTGDAIGDGGGNKRANTTMLREMLMRNGVLEVSGYPLGAALAEGMANAWLEALPQGSDVRWLEVLPDPHSTLGEAALRQMQTWNREGCRATVGTAVGPAFWQTQEINECPALIKSTLSAMPQ